MPKPTKPTKGKVLIRRKPSRADFDQVLSLIDAARKRAVAVVNTALIDLYWSIGEHISRRIAEAAWGQGAVEELAEYIQKRQPGISGYSAQNLWRMRQFYDTYHDQPILSTLLRELSWSHNLHIVSKCKTQQEREFYLRIAAREHWSSRELDRQISGALFERSILSPPKLAAVLRESHPEAINIFKDSYLVEFLQLPAGHSEADLHTGLVEHLRRFIIELGRDFCFIGSKYRIQVGNRDFEIDRLFFNRALNALVAIELKIDEFQPEHLGKMGFYLEALDRQMRKSHERPAIGLLLCATKDNEVVEYAMSRSVSPALVAEYATKLPDKQLLEAKLHEFYMLAASQTNSQKERTTPLDDAELDHGKGDRKQPKRKLRQ